MLFVHSVQFPGHLVTARFCSENASKLLSLKPFDLKQPATVVERDGVIAEDHPGEHENAGREEKGSRRQQEEVFRLRASLSQDWKQVVSLVSITP